MTIADMPRRLSTTTEEIAISLAAIADQLDTMNTVLERVAEALEGRLIANVVEARLKTGE